jgi:hypothetical protein
MYSAPKRRRQHLLFGFDLEAIDVQREDGNKEERYLSKGTIFAIVYRRLVPRLGHAQANGAIAHRLCRLIWKILHEGIRYHERGPAVSVEAKKVRTRKMIREQRTLGYRVELPQAPSSSPA